MSVYGLLPHIRNKDSINNDNIKIKCEIYSEFREFREIREFRELFTNFPNFPNNP